jgi:hypothetical protein
LILDIAGIEQAVKDYELESKALKDELFRICWYMRGSISYTESLMLSYEEREIISKIIEKNLEITKDSGVPFF